MNICIYPSIVMNIVTPTNCPALGSYGTLSPTIVEHVKTSAIPVLMKIFFKRHVGALQSDSQIMKFHRSLKDAKAYRYSQLRKRHQILWGK